MNYRIKIEKLLKEKKQTWEDLSSATGITNIKAVLSNEVCKALNAISEYFGMPIELFFADQKRRATIINNGIISDSINSNSITFGSTVLPEIEAEIIKQCTKMDIKRKNRLLAFAFKLAEETEDDPM